MEKRKLNDIDGSVLARAGAACVIHDLHAFTTIPTTVRPELLLTNEELSVELLRWPMGLCNGFADAQTDKNGRHRWSVCCGSRCSAVLPATRT
jgi:hypothetical protein